MIAKIVRLTLAKMSGSKFADKIVLACHQIILAAENGSNHDIATNGELRSFIEAARKIDGTLVVFDIGANVGGWTKTISNSSKEDTNIHLFEIVPATFEKLCRNVSGEQFYLNNVGLGDKEETVEINYYPTENTGSSIVRLPWSVKAEVVACKVITGDQYCAKNGIEKIHFLKIDAEGMDYRVLKGFSGMLEKKAISNIQFEINKAGILTKSLLIDFYELLEEKGYEIGRIYPKTTRFKPYELFRDELLVQGNYLARLKQ